MSPEWLIIRGSGIVAYVLLAGATIWGLLLSTKVLGRAVKAKPVTWFHESLGLGAVLATIVHMLALGADQYVDFGWRELLLPGASTWRPLPVAFGVTAFYALVVVAFSFYLKRFIRQSTWRSIHFLSFGTFVAVLLHGVLSGTDSGEPAVFGMYVATGTIVLVLITIRLVQARAPVSPDRKPSSQSGGGMPRAAEPGAPRPSAASPPSTGSLATKTATFGRQRTEDEIDTIATGAVIPEDRRRIQSATPAP